jgi:hypothetical protein
MTNDALKEKHKIAIQAVSARRDGDDRAEALPRGTGHLLVLADGAGGTRAGLRRLMPF